MSTKSLKIASISAEVEPYSKSGGLGSVAKSLPKALKRLKHDVVAITPLYDALIDKKKHNLALLAEGVEVLMNRDIKIKVDFYEGRLMKGLPIYFIANNKYFGRRKTMYGSSHDNARFMLFDLAALELLRFINFKPDIIQCHDWHTGLIPYFLKRRFKNEELFEKTAAIYTIHNLNFQMGKNWWEVPAEYKDEGTRILPRFHSQRLENINFAKRAIMNADMINTVSPQYAEEIMTKHFGEDLHRILKNRKDKLFGIINGIDYSEYNPKTDPGLYKNYDVSSLDRKADNKEALQKYFGLPVDRHKAVIGLTSRVTEQKGFKILLPILGVILRAKVQMVIMGDGSRGLIKEIGKKIKKHPKKLAYRKFDRNKETSVYAGADIFLLPSRFEPCGINQLISLRYGCVPITRAIGGLADTVSNYNPATGKGNGFSFKLYESIDLLVAIVRALETYKHKDAWNRLVAKGMTQSFSWEIPAQKYVALFRRAIKNRKGK